MTELLIIEVNVNDELNSGYKEEVHLMEDNDTPQLEQSIDSCIVPGEGANLQQELERVCRCCAVEGNNLSSIFDPGEYIASMLAVLTAIQPDRDDGLPSQICLTCLDSLAKSTNFKQRVETADKMFRHLLAMDLSQEREVRKSNVEQLAKSLSKMSEVDAFAPTSDVKQQEADSAEYLEDETFEVPKPDDEEEEEDEDEEVPSSPEEFLEDNEEGDQIEHTTGDCNTQPDTQSPAGRRSNRKNKRTFQCSMCDSKFSDVKAYIVHSKTHPGTKELFWCTVCNRNFKSRADMEHHYRCHPSSEQQVKCNYKCEICDTRFSVEDDLYIHGSIHDSRSKFVCRKCKKQFPNLVKLKRHVRIHFEDKPYKCDMCGKGFPEMASLTRHFRLHTGEKKERKHVCLTCGKGYFDRHSLLIHKRTHTGEKPWGCKECGKRFIDSRLLNSHLKIHKSEKMYACSICSKRFTHQSTLKTHIRLHTGEKPYVCQICSKSFIQSSNLNLHLRMHSGERPYKCKLCPGAFASSSTLNTHMRTHTGVKPYACPKCGKSFARHDLRAHLRTHTGEKPFMCEVCSRKFTTSGQLNQHKRSHGDQKRFKCKLCGKGWSTGASLKKHMKTSHKKAKKDQQTPYRTEDERVFYGHSDEFPSDSELNEDVMLVNDLLASVAENGVEIEEDPIGGTPDFF